MEPQGSDKPALKPSSPASAPTTPSPVLAASSFSRSTSASHTDSSPSCDNDGTAEPRPTSLSPQARLLQPAVAYAVRCIRQQYFGTLGHSPASPASRTLDPPSQEHTQAQNQRSQEQDSHSARSRGEDCAGDESLWLEIRLTEEEWLILQKHIQSLGRQDPGLRYYIEEKLRYDYFASLEILALRLRSTRMPSRIHELLIRNIDQEVHKQLALVALGERERDGNSPLVQFVRDIRPWGSLRMKFRHIPSKTPSEDGSDVGQEAGAMSQHEPDCSYSATNHDDSYPNLYPAAIIEVVTSKKRGRLAMLADDYLLGTDVGPMIQVMLAIDIDIERLESGPTSRRLARVMEYRRKETPSGDDDGPIFSVQETEHIFRDQDGTRLQGEVRLHLSDFAPFGDDPSLAGHGSDQSISLSFDWLNNLLSDAENQAAKAVESAKAARQGTKRKADEDVPEQGQAKRHAWPARGKRRGHEPPPVERLSVSDEERMQRAEEEADRRAVHQDKVGARAYVPRSQPGRSTADAAASSGEGEWRMSTRTSNKVS